MKSSIVLALSFLLFVFAASTSTNPVFDIDGLPLFTNTSYFIVSALFGSSILHGLNLVTGHNQTCPLDVALVSDEGRSLKFSPFNSNDTIVHSSIDLNINFTSAPNDCRPQPPVWKVDNYEESTGKWYITTDGVEENPGAQTLLNWFKFEKIGTSKRYRIVHCPAVCESCVHLCSNVSIYYGPDRVQRLALSEDPFPVQFVKADDA